MAPNNDPSPPNGGPGDHADCDSDTEECPHCPYWSEDHSTEISKSTSNWLTSSQSSARTKKWRLDANLASGSITITLVFKLGTLDSALTAAMTAAVKTAVSSAAPGAWSNKHDMKIIDPICGEKTLPVRFRVLWNPDDTTATEHYVVNISKTPVRSGVATPNVNLDHDADLADDAWTIKHEFGHTFAPADEYFYSGVTAATIDYKRADGSTETITLEPSASIMKTRGNTTVRKRFLYFAEIEAQALLRAESGRNVTCEIV